MIKKLLSIAISISPGFLKIPAYRLLFNANIGKGVKIGFGTFLLADQISIGNHTSIGWFNKIEARIFKLGRYAKIGNFNNILVREFAVGCRGIISSHVDIKGDLKNNQSCFRMGMHSWVFDYCYINVVRSVILGANVGVGGGSYIFTHGLWLCELDGFPVSYNPVQIDDNTWLPWGCFIMPGVHIGRDVIVGARSLVNKNVPDHALVAGVPAKLLKEKSNRDVSHEEKIIMLKNLTEEFGKENGGHLVWHETAGDITATMQGRPLLCIHKQADSPLAPEALNLLFYGRPKHSTHAWLSLEDYSSSPYGEMTSIVRNWLTYGRRIGLRFYPVDESDS